MPGDRSSPAPGDRDPGHQAPERHRERREEGVAAEHRPRPAPPHQVSRTQTGVGLLDGDSEKPEDAVVELAEEEAQRGQAREGRIDPAIGSAKPDVRGYREQQQESAGDLQHHEGRVLMEGGTGGHEKSYEEAGQGSISAVDLKAGPEPCQDRRPKDGGEKSPRDGVVVPEEEECGGLQKGKHRGPGSQAVDFTQKAQEVQTPDRLGQPDAVASVTRHVPQRKALVTGGEGVDLGSDPRGHHRGGEPGGGTGRAREDGRSR